MLATAADRLRDDGAPQRRLAVDQRDVAGGALGVLGAQIVMATEDPPRIGGRAVDLQLDTWAGLNRPPGERPGLRVVDPVRLQPVDDVVVAADREQLLPGGAPDVFRDGRRRDLRDGAVNEAGELVDDGQPGFGERPGQVDPELLALAEGDEGAEPKRRQKGRRERERSTGSLGGRSAG